MSTTMEIPRDIIDALGDANPHPALDDTLQATCPFCGNPNQTLQVSSVAFVCIQCEIKGTHNQLREALGLELRIFSTLAELLARPELLEPPECVLPRLAYRGRGVLLAAPDKAGKSTLLAHGATALSRGRSWLGEATTPGRVVWLGLEEALGDAVRRFAELGADPERVQLVTMSPPDLRERLDALLTEWPADMVVVDSLHEFARTTLGESPGDGDNASWGSVVRPLIALARKHNVAVVLLHHVRRSDGRARGASEIFAAVDATLEMYLPTKEEDPTSRRIAGRGRWSVETFRVSLRDGRYGLSSGGGISLDARVLLAIEANPGCNLRRIRDRVTGAPQAISKAVLELMERGAVVDRGEQKERSPMVLYTTAAAAALEVAS